MMQQIIHVKHERIYCRINFRQREKIKNDVTFGSNILLSNCNRELHAVSKHALLLDQLKSKIRQHMNVISNIKKRFFLKTFILSFFP